MRRADIGALLAFALLGWHRAAADRAGGLGRLAFYWLILLIFWALWKATPLQELGRPGLDATRLFWYMAVTESVVIAVGFPYREIERVVEAALARLSLRDIVIENPPLEAVIAAIYRGETGSRVPP